MERGLYESDHEEFRGLARNFVAREVAGHVDEWDAQHSIDSSVWRAAGDQGLLGIAVPEEFGGAGIADYRYRCVIVEELARVQAGSLAAGFSVQDDIVIPYILSLGTPEQKRRWLPDLVSGVKRGSIGMTEPGAGSDLRGIRTNAVKTDGGWILNGAKTFITSGITSDIIVTATKTDSVDAAGSHAFSLVVVESGMNGFDRGRKLAKLGLHGQDTAELFFHDVFIPDANVLGDIGGGLIELMKHLPLERLSIAVQAIASAAAVFEATLAYTNEREAFGKPIADFQNTRFELAEMSTEIDVTRAYLDKAVLAYNDGQLSAVEAAKAKWWATDMQGRVIDRCLQLFGGYGYMMEYPVARAYQDARVQRIFGGTNEIMKELIGRDLVGRR